MRSVKDFVKIIQRGAANNVVVNLRINYLNIFPLSQSFYLGEVDDLLWSIIINGRNTLGSESEFASKG